MARNQESFGQQLSNGQPPVRPQGLGPAESLHPDNRHQRKGGSSSFLVKPGYRFRAKTLAARGRFLTYRYTQNVKSWECNSVVQHLPSALKVLGAIPRTTKTKSLGRETEGEMLAISSVSYGG